MKIDYSPLAQDISQPEIDQYTKVNNIKVYLNKKTINFVALIILIVMVLGKIISLLFVFLSGFKSIQLLDLFAGLWYFIVLPIIYLILLAVEKGQLAEIKRNIKLTNFASKNGFQYQIKNSNMMRQGLIFNRGSNRVFKDIIDLQSNDKKFEIANYSFDIRKDDDTVTYTYGYIMIQLDRKLPHMILDSKLNNGRFFGLSMSNLPISLRDNQRLQLEGDFNEYFTLYVPNSYERDAFYIFTPDLMALFIDESYFFDAEIIDDRLFIYSPHRFDLLDSDLLGRIFRIIETVGQKTVRRSRFYADEKVGDKNQNTITLSGSKLKKSNIVIVVFIAIALLFFVFIFFMFLGSIFSFKLTL